MIPKGHGVRGCVSGDFRMQEPTKRNLWRESLCEGNKISMKTNFCWKPSPLVLAGLLGPGRGRQSLPEESGGPQIVQISACSERTLFFPACRKKGLGVSVRMAGFLIKARMNKKELGATEQALGL